MRFDELGHTVARLQDGDRDALGRPELAADRFVRAFRRSQSRVRGVLLWSAAAAFLLVGGLGVVWVGSAKRARLELAEQPGIRVGEPIVAPSASSIPLRFSDGSRVELAAGTKANVVELSENGALLELESGAAEASVVHRASTHWTLRAGPYRVLVTGTRFQMLWSPNQARFELVLTNGSVVVTPDNSSHAAVTMKAPERLVIERGEWQLSPMIGEPSPSPPTAAAELPQSAGTASALRARADAVPSAQPPLPPAASTALVSEWQRLGKQGAFPAAYENAQRFGIANLAQSASAADLLTLAEVCRFTGHQKEALEVLTKLRQRFAGRDEAAIAAFQLGRLSGDGQRAASWFRTYLKDRPTGGLAREASGRLIEALDRAGDHAAAVGAAKDYLARYPSGPHADFARRLASP
ncbi:MAG TPA: FecR domain-containing protein [Polyangiaceae bacterium]|nr:FecR domain-containing protein [Polyangiaceae bacterium]